MNVASKIQLRIVTLMVGVVILATVLAGVVQFAQNNHNRQLQSRNDTQMQFWNIVATGESNTISPEHTLAKDLHAILGDTEKINSFRGDSNLYGGVTYAIGFDPFNGANCSECGPLDTSVKRNLDLIAKGDLSQVIADNKVTYKNDYTLTPFGIPTWKYLMLLYIVIGGGSYVIAMETAGEKWRTDTQMLVSAPGVYVVESFKNRKRTHKDDSQVRRQFPEYCALLDDVDESISSLPQGDDRNTLKKRRDEVRLELLRQARSSHNAKSTDEMKDLAQALDVLSTTLKARSEARQDLDEY